MYIIVQRSFLVKNGKFDDQPGKKENNDFLQIDFLKIFITQNLMLISMEKSVKIHKPI